MYREKSVLDGRRDKEKFKGNRGWALQGEENFNNGRKLK